MRNLDGHGVRVIITGEKGEGDAELFNLLNIVLKQEFEPGAAPLPIFFCVNFGI